MSLYSNPVEELPHLSVRPGGHDPPPSAALVAQHGLNLVEGVCDPACELLAAPVALQKVKPELSVIDHETGGENQMT